MHIPAESVSPSSVMSVVTTTSRPFAGRKIAQSSPIPRVTLSPRTPANVLRISSIRPSSPGPSPSRPRPCLPKSPHPLSISCASCNLTFTSRKLRPPGLSNRSAKPCTPGINAVNLSSASETLAAEGCRAFLLSGWPFHPSAPPVSQRSNFQVRVSACQQKNTTT